MIIKKSASQKINSASPVQILKFIVPKCSRFYWTGYPIWFAPCKREMIHLKRYVSQVYSLLSMCNLQCILNHLIAEDVQYDWAIGSSMDRKVIRLFFCELRNVSCFVQCENSHIEKQILLRRVKRTGHVLKLIKKKRQSFCLWLWQVLLVIEQSISSMSMLSVCTSQYYVTQFT